MSDLALFELISGIVVFSAARDVNCFSNIKGNSPISDQFSSTLLWLCTMCICTKNYLDISKCIFCLWRDVRLTAMEQFLIMSTKCTGAAKSLVFFITLLFTVLSVRFDWLQSCEWCNVHDFSILQTTVKEYAAQSNEFFMLLCRLLNYAYCTNVQLQNSATLLNNEIEWLRKVRVSSR